MNKKDNILIIGAGLCGSLLALRLAQRGYKVNVYESRPDLRTIDISAGRSINLALSDRGFKALRLAGVAEKAREICIPMYGRLIHDIEGNTFSSNYSGRDNECINSISRGDLNAILLTEAEKHENVSIHFNKKCTSVDIENTIANFKDYHTKEEFSVDAEVIFGTDGSGSVLRKSYYLERKFLFSYSQNYLSHGYKELEIPADKIGNHQISNAHLHIWPRGAYMLIALPNMDGSFTVTLFLSYDEGEYNFDNLTSEEKITAFFETQFPDALKLIPNIKEEFLNNPTGALGTVKCSPWHYKNKTILLGDAAHAIVPFYGQGMNASFEDITIFDAVLEENLGDWETVFKTYEKARKENTDAIADLAIDNFHEMKNHVANPLFKEKRKLEMALEKAFPNEYFSKYSMVTFKEDIPYADAMKKGRAQDKALLNMVADSDFKHTTDLKYLKEILQKVVKETNEILKEDEIAGL
ncbi:FAD-dependent oxidoreductase [Tenacibaculum finnmarkense]|uniref:Kynurenine 3-monooxygenase n=1 Tax=Tenacibaculum finnmarkense genomovar finnmarkense TaxID=1458503 RepID=A0AAP1RG56_9FLAO|nr:NAD(P)/FAD-dependent oxidoreductase [Tenacibaculum finnmarkense]MBE7653309.1 NAD(P)-binding protein [Tenacibaculum finnmarkense genomovar finnmarkense]MBE7695610.1 NAD(P)-binding protein [Tenacibaculum finnmarkense genomovar finnmarkense]MCD8427728.1 FAD-dependent monooxygenase [Tenacibaculum finnmarkense genomovar finnmarkense]MCG8731860.1 FAD-dependent monooxygenase [Tenacibaculum finnmarkense]MCG8752029.1 FAD-dependent monooxygenase [Tenacibaculum finnmarkense]